MEEEEQAQKEEGEDKLSLEHLDLKTHTPSTPRPPQSEDVPYKRLLLRRKIRLSHRFVFPRFAALGTNEISQGRKREENEEF